MIDFIHLFLSFFIGIDIENDPVSLQAHTSVSFIYFSFLLMLIYFNYILIFYFSLKQEKNRYVFLEKNKVMIDFLINYSVALGVMGTLVSIGVAFANSDGNIADVISKYFGSALLTTVVGIFLYGYFFIWYAILATQENKDEPTK